MAGKRVRFTINAFFGDDEIDAEFPEDWAVAECRMAGHGAEPMCADQIRAALANPVGTPRLRDMARGKERVCIIFDDLPKPTRTDRIAPFVIEELHAGGITDDQIRFVCGPGTHHPLSYAELAAKLGADIVERYPVYNHSIWENLVFKGSTSAGTPVWINREFDSCDLRLGIGSIFPHGGAGFGGGGKLILPGISGIETVASHHLNTSLKRMPIGVVEGNKFREDIEEAARLAGLMFKVDVVINEKREAIGLFCGDFVQEHRAGVPLARKTYATPIARDADVVVTNTYPDEGQMGRGHWMVPMSLRDGGDVVVLTHFHEGQNLHQFNSRFGTDFGGRGYKPGGRYPALANASRVLIMSRFLSKYDRDQAGPPEKVAWCRDWDSVLAELTCRHGRGTKVAVYPYSTLQVPTPELPAPEYEVG
jgi:lactate racemase